MSRPPSVPGSPDPGSATIWVVALASILWCTAAVAVVVADVRATHHEARAAADMAALAAAGRARGGEAMACRAADSVARANGSRLVTCVVRGGIADVTVEVPLSLPFGLRTGVDGVIMRARAGPSQPGAEQITAGVETR